MKKLTRQTPPFTIDNLSIKLIHRNLHLLIHLLDCHSQMFLNVCQVLYKQTHSTLNISINTIRRLFHIIREDDECCQMTFVYTKITNGRISKFLLLIKEILVIWQIGRPLISSNLCQETNVLNVSNEGPVSWRHD